MFIELHQIWWSGSEHCPQRIALKSINIVSIIDLSVRDIKGLVANTHLTVIVNDKTVTYQVTETYDEVIAKLTGNHTDL